jgi:hypothetical protein
VTRSRALRGLVVATVAGCVLSGCASHPGSAAVVGSERISDSRLEDVAGAFCALASTAPPTQGQTQEQPSKTARLQALGVLIDDSLSRQFAETEGVEPNQGQVSAFVARSQTTLDALPAEQRSVFREILTEYAEAQLSLLAVGRRSLRRAGTARPAPQQSITEANRLRSAWAAENADVSVDPRYGTYAKGVLQPADGSLSVPVSASAKAAAAATPAPAWVEGLPASQKCA